MSGLANLLTSQVIKTRLTSLSSLSTIISKASSEGRTGTVEILKHYMNGPAGNSISDFTLQTAAAVRVRWESSAAALGTSAATLAKTDRRKRSPDDLSYVPPENSPPSIYVDTLDMMKRFERLGVTREQAEALTQTLTEMLCSQREKLVEECASKALLEKSELQSQASIAGFRAEVLKSQELQVASFTRDTERLQANLEKVRSEIRYEIDKLTAAQRLDLNLEKGRMRDELQALRDKTNELEIKVDKEVNSLKAAMEQSKNDTVKYVLGLMLALMTAGLGAARLVMH